MIWEINDTHCIALMAAIMKSNEPLIGMKKHAENACFLFFHISEYLDERVEMQKSPKSLGDLAVLGGQAPPKIKKDHMGYYVEKENENG